MAEDRRSESPAPELSEFEQLLRAKKIQREADCRRGAPLFKISPGDAQIEIGPYEHGYDDLVSVTVAPVVVGTLKPL
jgi:hypothetical protein